MVSLEHLRHSLAHLLASAVLETFPEAKLGVGPVIENGFFYDFLLPRTLTPEDLKELQKRMRKLIGQRLVFERTEMTTAEAKKFFRERGQPFKVELIEDIDKFGTTKADGILRNHPQPSLTSDATVRSPTETSDLREGADASSPLRVRGDRGVTKVTLYKTGKFIDLCRGGHVENTSAIDARGFQLWKISGAYWRGDEKREQMQRIYGLAFASEEELKSHLMMLSEAEKRDHRRVGVELDLFTFSDLVGGGLPMFTPRGTLIRKLLTQFLDELKSSKGYEQVDIPHLAKPELYKTSGHWDKFQDHIFHVQGKSETFVLKPMNCPHHIQIYASRPRSYRDLPLRYAETTKMYRDEQTGELHGLTRVRSISIDDAHVFVRSDQILQEAKNAYDIIHAFYRVFGFKLRVRLSLRDPHDKSKYLGSDKIWDMAEGKLKELLEKEGKDYTVGVGEAAFYGPKLDFMAKDSIGREWQLSTIQLDFNQPERFGLEYADEQGGKTRPVMLHIAIAGSLERFMGILIEHFAGAFPVWLSPVQVYIAPVGKAHYGAARKLGKMLSAQGMRVEVDEARETVPYKVRKAEKQKVPYILVVGDREKPLKKLTVRIRGQQRQPQMTLSAFVKRVKKEIEKKQ